MKILLGIQPTWRLHIGNYFGALKKWLEMQEQWYEVTFLVANYHANAEPKNIVYMRDDLQYKFGCKNVHIQKPEVLEKFYELAHDTSVSELARLPQYQTKGQTLHMLSYPLLMAADIIISDADAVIVGDDQEPHMHFYREIARRNWYKEAITIKSDTPRLMSILDPSKKMSKSLGDDHCIYLDDDDDLDALTRKIMKAPTTPEGIENIKSIAKLYGFVYDESRNKESKEWLIKSICNFIY